MIYLNKELESAFEETFMLSVRPEKVIYKMHKQPVIIPSKEFPLNNKKNIQLFCYFNTEPLEDEVIKEIFNKIRFESGYCYKGAENTRDALIEAGLNPEDIQTYVGWITPYRLLPVHHSWVIYKKKYILDGTLFTLDANQLGLADKSVDEQREIYTDALLIEMEKPNSDTRVFGQTMLQHFYVGSPCDPDEGRTIYNDLIDKYPNHISYNQEGQNPNGKSKTQEILYKKMK